MPALAKLANPRINLAAMAFKATLSLPEGTYVVRLLVQGEHGLWSEAASAALEVRDSVPFDSSLEESSPGASGSGNWLLSDEGTEFHGRLYASTRDPGATYSFEIGKWTEFTYGLAGVSGARDLRETRDGGYILAGESDGNAYMLQTDKLGEILWEKQLALGAANSVDLSGDGGYVVAGTTEGMIFVAKISGAIGQTLFRRGDVNGNGKVDPADAFRTLGWLTQGEGGPACPDAADIDDDGQVSITDVIRIMQFVHMRGQEPEPPGPWACGVDPNDDDLSDCVYEGIKCHPPVFDCNGNGKSDGEDIAGGFSLDCDRDAIPDDCEGPMGLSGYGCSLESYLSILLEAPLLEGLTIDGKLGELGNLRVSLGLAYDERGRLRCRGRCLVDQDDVIVDGTMKRRGSGWRYGMTLRGPDRRATLSGLPSSGVTGSALRDLRIRLSGLVGTGVAEISYRGPLGKYRGPLGKLSIGDVPVAEAALENVECRIAFRPVVEGDCRFGGTAAIAGGFGNWAGALKARVLRGNLVLTVRDGRKKLSFRGKLEGGFYVGRLRVKWPPEKSVHEFSVPVGLFPCEGR